MDFQWLDTMSVRSSEGFSLERMHRFFYHYVEGPRRMQVNAEGLEDAEGRYGEEIDTASLQRWLPPHDEEPVTPEKHAQIRRNIEAALAFKGTWYRFT
jgi:hypothetical protein